MAFLIYISVMALSMWAYVTHIITSVHAEMIFFLIVGIVIPPVGIIHGALVLMGVL